MLLFVLLTVMTWHQGVRSAEICCATIGCFSDAPPFDGITLPQCIETMNPRYLMFTRANQLNGELFTHTTVPSVYDGARRTIFLVHGWNSNGNSAWLQSMKIALLDKDDVNVVIVDWGGGAELLNYFQSASNTRTMGAYTALVFDNLIVNGGATSRSWCMGHSLGAHLCGHTGMRSVQRLQRVTGLDPAGPFFQGKLDRTVGVNPTSAIFVDVIHTDVELGQLRDLGHVDFYPAGGATQPGCFLSDTTKDIDLMNSCAHSRAHQYMEQSVKTDCFVSTSICTDYNNVPASCSACTCGTNPCARLGYSAESSCRSDGMFYVDVVATPPYCVSI